jgi:superfamily II DNA or RNA helicase
MGFALTQTLDPMPLDYCVVDRPIPETYTDDKVPHIGLRDTQQPLFDQALTILRTHHVGSCLISAPCGFGKTYMSLALAITLGQRVLVVIGDRNVLLKQWEDACAEHFGSVCAQRIKKPAERIHPDTQLILINVGTLARCDLRHINQHVGTIILDEVHTFCTQARMRVLLGIFPRYLIGLSATPYRNDGQDKILELWFPQPHITASRVVNHTVYHVPTHIQFKTDASQWTNLLTEQAQHEGRNAQIASIPTQYPDRCFLVLCKRIAQGNTLCALLEQSCPGQVDNLLGGKNAHDKEKRILIATAQKCGMGFDDPRFDALIVAADLEMYFIQYLGRIFRCRSGREPIVFDIVDGNRALDRHWKKRKAVYKKNGGTITLWKPDNRTSTSTMRQSTVTQFFHQ